MWPKMYTVKCGVCICVLCRNVGILVSICCICCHSIKGDMGVASVVFQSTYTTFQFTNMIFLSRYNKTIRLLHIYILGQISVEECCADIHLIRDNKYETGIGNCCACSMYNHVSDVTKRQTPWPHACYIMGDFQ